ncbi:MAG: MFS transporter [Thermoplasmata archaeon]
MERNLQLLTVGVAIRSVGAALYNPFLALFLYSVLHVGYLEIGLIFVGVGGIQIPFGIVGGFWTDRVGRRRLIGLGLATETVLTAALAYAFEVRSLELAVAAAAVGGALLAATGSAYSAYAADWATGPDRTRAFTWYRIGYNAGFSTGVALGGVLVASVGFTSAVAIAAVLIAGATVFVFAFIGPSPFDLALRDRPSIASAPPAGTDVKPRSTLRASFSKLLQDRVALLVAAGFALVYVTSGQWNVTFSLFVHNKLGISYTLLGIGLALNGLIVVFGQSITTESVIGRRHTSLAIVGSLLYAVAFLLLGVSALWLLLPGAIFLAAVLVLTLGENLLAIPTSTLPSNLAPGGEIGAYNGAFNASLSAAALAATFFGGAVLSAVANPVWEWVLLALPTIPGIILLRYAAGRIPGRADRA